LPKLTLTDIEHFGGWRTAQNKHFNDGGTFDEIYRR
jgi:sulfate transport system substrate-binding protein